MAIFQHSPHSRGQIPAVWLMSDERMGTAFLPSVQAMPRGSGVILRHYTLTQTDRRALFRRVRQIARRRGLMVFLAGSARQAQRWGADGYHGRINRQLKRVSVGRAQYTMLHSAPVHDRSEIAVNLSHADLFFLSPVYATSSHVGARSLGPLRCRRLAALCDAPVIALGGMTRPRFMMLSAKMRSASRRSARADIHGWAAIDALAKS